MLQQSMPAIKVKPRQNAVARMAENPTMLQRRDIILSVTVLTPRSRRSLRSIIGVNMPPIIQIRNHNQFHAGLWVRYSIVQTASVTAIVVYPHTRRMLPLPK